MQWFSNYLVSKHFTSKKQSHFYQLWVKTLYDLIGKTLGETVENEDIDGYINYITKSKQDWQVKQAQEAIRVYLHYKSRPAELQVSTDGYIKAQWKLVGSQMVNMLRLKQLSLQTERTYMTWFRDFYRFVKDRSPYLVDGSHVKRYLTYLAVERHVAPSTQNQALNAFLPFYIDILKKPPLKPVSPKRYLPIRCATALPPA